MAQGVSFFFILSGFILVHAHPQLPSIREFLVKRFARLWPLHLLTFLLIAVFFTPPFSAGTTVLNLLMLHGWIPIAGSVYSYNAVSWSISDEWFFYLFFPLLLRAKSIVPAVIGSLLLTIALIICANRFWNDSFGVSVGFSWIHVILQNPLCRILEFVVGVALGRFFVRSRGRLPALIGRLPTMSEVVAVCLAAGALVATTRDQWLRDGAGSWSLTGPGLATWYNQMGALPAFAIVILVFAYARGWLSRMLSFPLFVLLGEISYATYMLHQIVLGFASKLSLRDHLGTAGAWALTALAVYVASYAVWRWIEVPARRAIVRTQGSVFKSP